MIIIDSTPGSPTINRCVPNLPVEDPGSTSINRCVPNLPIEDGADTLSDIDSLIDSAPGSPTINRCVPNLPVEDGTGTLPDADSYPDADADLSVAHGRDPAHLFDYYSRWQPNHPIRFIQPGNSGFGNGAQWGSSTVPCSPISRSFEGYPRFDFLWFRFFIPSFLRRASYLQSLTLLCPTIK